jgi:hypothetical protein
LVSSKNSFNPDPADNNFDETLVSVSFSGNFDALQTSQVEKWFNGPFSSKKKKGVLANKHSNGKPSLRYVLLTKNQQHSTTSVLVLICSFYIFNTRWFRESLFGMPSA